MIQPQQNYLRCLVGKTISRVETNESPLADDPLDSPGEITIHFSDGSRVEFASMPDGYGGETVIEIAIYSDDGVAGVGE